MLSSPPTPPCPCGRSARQPKRRLEARWSPASARTSCSWMRSLSGNEQLRPARHPSRVPHKAVSVLRVDSGRGRVCWVSQHPQARAPKTAVSMATAPQQATCGPGQGPSQPGLRAAGPGGRVGSALPASCSAGFIGGGECAFTHPACRNPS